MIALFYLLNKEKIDIHHPGNKLECSCLSWRLYDEEVLTCFTCSVYAACFMCRARNMPANTNTHHCQVAAREKELVDALKSMLGIHAIVKLVAPKSITRSEGKAVRVIDKRNLY